MTVPLSHSTTIIKNGNPDQRGRERHRRSSQCQSRRRELRRPPPRLGPLPTASVSNFVFAGCGCIWAAPRRPPLQAPRRAGASPAPGAARTCAPAAAAGPLRLRILCSPLLRFSRLCARPSTWWLLSLLTCARPCFPVRLWCQRGHHASLPRRGCCGGAATNTAAAGSSPPGGRDGRSAGSPGGAATATVRASATVEGRAWPPVGVRGGRPWGRQ